MPKIVAYCHRCQHGRADWRVTLNLYGNPPERRENPTVLVCTPCYQWYASRRDMIVKATYYTGGDV